MARRNISLPDDLDARARTAGLNVSAITRAALLSELDRRERMARLDDLLDDLDAVHGPPSEQAVADARAVLDGAVPVRRARSKPVRGAAKQPAARRAAG